MLAVALLVDPAPARAAFHSINGLDPKELHHNKVAVALTSVKELAVSWRTSFARSGHLELQNEEHVFGPRPAAAAFKRVPYTSGVGYNSAWPDLGAKPVGTFLVMAWRKGHPCGEGSAIRLGERFSLPLLVSGPADPRVAAVRQVLKIVTIVEPAEREKKLRTAFSESANPYLVLFADGALNAADPQHYASGYRYARLLGIINSAPGADEELGWPLLQELTRFPPIRDGESYASWRKDHAGPLPDRGWPSWSQFRQLLHTRFRGFASNPKASVDLRRWALSALASPPSFLGIRRDRLDAKAVAAVIERLRDPVVVVRRDATRALLAMAAALQSSDRPTSQRLLAQVRQVLRRETDPDERANLKLRIDELAEH